MSRKNMFNNYLSIFSWALQKKDISACKTLEKIPRIKIFMRLFSVKIINTCMIFNERLTKDYKLLFYCMLWKRHLTPVMLAMLIWWALGFDEQWKWKRLCISVIYCWNLFLKHKLKPLNIMATYKEAHKNSQLRQYYYIQLFTNKFITFDGQTRNRGLQRISLIWH